MLTTKDLFAAIVVVAAVMSVLMAISWASQAKAHSDGKMTYPAHCCHDMDCAPVDKVEIVNRVQAGMSLMPEGKLPTIMFVTTKHGTAMVPENFKRDTSTDGRMHACIRQVGMVKKLICIFDPPAM